MPSNEKKQRDPEMCRTKKGNRYYFGMKSHIGVDAGGGYARSLETTAANVRDITITSRLIREDDTVVYADAGYPGIEKREGIALKRRGRLRTTSSGNRDLSRKRYPAIRNCPASPCPLAKQALKP
jgi:IS5 family transposase